MRLIRFERKIQKMFPNHCSWGKNVFFIEDTLRNIILSSEKEAKTHVTNSIEMLRFKIKYHETRRVEVIHYRRRDLIFYLEKNIDRIMLELL